MSIRESSPPIKVSIPWYIQRQNPLYLGLPIPGFPWPDALRCSALKGLLPGHCAGALAFEDCGCATAAVLTFLSFTRERERERERDL